MSLSARRAWIEIDIEDKFGGLVSVALRKESVDRNKHTQPAEQVKAVALRKESVDRNSNPTTMRSVIGMSLSARRAWIEIKNNRFRNSICFEGRSPQGERG